MKKVSESIKIECNVHKKRHKGETNGNFRTKDIAKNFKNHTEMDSLAKWDETMNFKIEQ